MCRCRCRCLCLCRCLCRCLCQCRCLCLCRVCVCVCVCVCVAMAVCRVCLCMHVRCICSPLLCSLMGRSSYTEYLELKKEKNAELFSYFDAIICGVRWVAALSALAPVAYQRTGATGQSKSEGWEACPRHFFDRSCGYWGRPTAMHRVRRFRSWCPVSCCGWHACCRNP